MATFSVIETPRPTVRYLDLPLKIRARIYHFLFAGIRLLDSSSPIHSNQSFLERFRPVNAKEIAIIHTNKVVREEALSTLASVATLIIRSDLKRFDPLSTFKDDYLLQCLKYVDVHVDKFPHLRRKRLPALCKIRLFGDARNVLDFDIFCEFINGPGVGNWALSECMKEETLSWAWKRKQYLHLSHEEGWALEIALRYEGRDEYSYWVPLFSQAMYWTDCVIKKFFSTLRPRKNFMDASSEAVDKLKRMISHS